jgi:SlyX protein
LSLSLDELTGRIEELESQAAFQDELHQRLNEIVARQDREILELKRQLAELGARIMEVGEQAAGADPGQEVPPHY